MAVTCCAGALGFGGQFTAVVIGVARAVVGIKPVTVIVNSHQRAVNMGAVAIEVVAVFFEQGPVFIDAPESVGAIVIIVFVFGCALNNFAEISDAAFSVAAGDLVMDFLFCWSRGA